MGVIRYICSKFTGNNLSQIKFIVLLASGAIAPGLTQEKRSTSEVPSCHVVIITLVVIRKKPVAETVIVMTSNNF